MESHQCFAGSQAVGKYVTRQTKPLGNKSRILRVPRGPKILIAQVPMPKFSPFVRSDSGCEETVSWYGGGVRG